MVYRVLPYLSRFAMLCEGPGKGSAASKWPKAPLLKPLPQAMWAVLWWASCRVWFMICPRVSGSFERLGSAVFSESTTGQRPEHHWLVQGQASAWMWCFLQRSLGGHEHPHPHSLKANCQVPLRPTLLTSTPAMTERGVASWGFGSAGV